MYGIVASVTGEDITDGMPYYNLHCCGVCSSFRRLNTTMKCEHLVVCDYTNVFVVITVLLCYGNHCYLKEERKDKSRRRKVVLLTPLSVGKAVLTA
jgi:hypothetical protein